MTRILSIQSHVVFGHAGNASAVFPMQRLGVEVMPVNTVQFSNHTGYGAWRGEAFPAELIDACVLGVSERGALGACDGVLSGYVGSAATGGAVARAVAATRAANKRALYCCDPVMGDVGRGLFVAADIPDFFLREAVPAADIVTPNQFELDLLSGVITASDAELKRAIARLHALGPGVILVTSVLTQETPADALDIVASDGKRVWRVRTPRLDLVVNGAGDMVAALFLTHYLRTKSARKALESATASTFGVLAYTLAVGAREIAIEAAQDEFIAPSRMFKAATF